MFYPWFRPQPNVSKVSIDEAIGLSGSSLSLKQGLVNETTFTLASDIVSVFIAFVLPWGLGVLLLTYSKGVQSWLEGVHGGPLLVCYLAISLGLCRFIIGNNRGDQSKRRAIIEACRGRDIVVTEGGIYFNAIFFCLIPSFKPDYTTLYHHFTWDALVTWDVIKTKGYGGKNSRPTIDGFYYDYVLTFRDQSKLVINRMLLGTQERELMNLLAARIQDKVRLYDEVRDILKSDLF